MHIISITDYPKCQVRDVQCGVLYRTYITTVQVLVGDERTPPKESTTTFKLSSG